MGNLFCRKQKNKTRTSEKNEWSKVLAWIQFMIQHVSYVELYFSAGLPVDNFQHFNLSSTHSEAFRKAFSNLKIKFEEEERMNVNVRIADIIEKISLEDCNERNKRRRLTAFVEDVQLVTIYGFDIVGEIPHVQISDDLSGKINVYVTICSLEEFPCDEWVENWRNFIRKQAVQILGSDYYLNEIDLAKFRLE